MDITMQFLRDLKACNQIDFQFKGAVSAIILHYQGKAGGHKTIRHEYDSGSVRGSWILSHYPHQNYKENTIIGLLRAHDEIHFDIVESSDECATMNNVCLRHLMLHVIRRRHGEIKKEMEFVLDTQLLPANIQTAIKLA